MKGFYIFQKIKCILGIHSWVGSQSKICLSCNKTKLNTDQQVDIPKVNEKSNERVVPQRYSRQELKNIVENINKIAEFQRIQYSFNKDTADKPITYH